MAWRESASGCAVSRLQLPESTPALTEQRIARTSGAARCQALPGAMAAAIETIKRHLGGELQDFREIPLDLTEVPGFDRAVYEAAMGIPAGQTRTYGEIAQLISPAVQASFTSRGRSQQLPIARAVGQALARNPIPILIPCHRVLAANGRLGGFSAPGALLTKTKLLHIEGARFPGVLAFPA